RIEAIGLYHEVRLEVAWQPARQQRSDGRRFARLKQWSIGRSIQAASQFGGLRRQRDDAVALADARPVVLAHRRAAADRDDDAVAHQRALQAARLALAEPGLAFTGENLGNRPPRIRLDHIIEVHDRPLEPLSQARAYR